MGTIYLYVEITINPSYVVYGYIKDSELYVGISNNTSENPLIEIVKQILIDNPKTKKNHL